RGQASPENLWRYARLWLPVADLVDLVLGTPPRRDASHTAEVAFDTATGWICLQRALVPGAQLVWFSTTGLPLAAEERGGDGRPTWRASFDRYQDHGGVPVATHLGLELPAWSRSMELTLEDIDVNPDLDHAVFAVQAPRGSKVVDLDRVVQ